MSYGRILETGHYIWPDENGIHFDNEYIPNETINVFLAKIYDYRRKEFKDRIKQGRRSIKLNKMNLGENNE